MSRKKVKDTHCLHSITLWRIKNAGYQLCKLIDILAEKVR